MHADGSRRVWSRGELRGEVAVPTRADAQTIDLCATIGICEDSDETDDVPIDIDVDSDGNLYTADVHVGRPQKFRPKPGANPAWLVGRPTRAATNE